MPLRSFRAVLAVILLFAVGACGESSVEVNTSPSLTILAPFTGSILVGGTGVVLEATATDSEDGSLASSIAWTSDLDGPLGTGGTITVNLSIGEHVIQATVTDSGASTDTASVTVDVVPEPERVTDLRVESVNDSTVALTWTEVSDGLGDPAAYQVDFGASPVNPANADPASAGSCADVVGATVGNELSCEVTGLRSGTTYGFLVSATRSLSNGETAVGPASDVTTTTTDYYEDFSRFQVGDVPEAPHDGLTYTTNDGSNTVTVQVVSDASVLVDQPLLLAKADQAVAGAPNFAMTSNSDLGLMYAPGGVLTIAFDLVASTDTACQLVGVRPGGADPTAWISVFGSSTGGDYVVGQLYEMALTLDLDTETISATRNGTPIEVSTRSADSGDVLTGTTLDYPYHPARFSFGGCGTWEQDVAVDNVSMTLRLP